MIRLLLMLAAPLSGPAQEDPIDPPPTVRLLSPSWDAVEVSERGILFIVLEAADDKGLGEIAIEYRFANRQTEWREIRIPPENFLTLDEGAPSTGPRRVLAGYEIDLPAVGAKAADELRIRIRAADFRDTGPARTTLSKMRVYRVVGARDMEARLTDRIERAAEELEALARFQKACHDRTLWMERTWRRAGTLGDDDRSIILDEAADLDELVGRLDRARAGAFDLLAACVYSRCHEVLDVKRWVLALSQLRTAPLGEAAALLREAARTADRRERSRLLVASADRQYADLSAIGRAVETMRRPLPLIDLRRFVREILDAQREINRALDPRPRK